jgi:hypothetical protein
MSAPEPNRNSLLRKEMRLPEENEMNRFTRTAAGVFVGLGLTISIAPAAGAATTAHPAAPASTFATTAVPLAATAPTSAAPTVAGHYHGDCDYDRFCNHDGGWVWYYDSEDDCWRW